MNAYNKAKSSLKKSGRKKDDIVYIIPDRQFNKIGKKKRR